MGFEVENFINLGDLAEDLICTICHGVYDKPLITRCRHTFCQDCIQTWIRSNNSCPLDYLPINSSSLVEAPLFVQNIISRLLVHCDYRDKGCEKIVKLENLEKHKADCKYRPSHCKIGGNIFNLIANFLGRNHLHSNNSRRSRNSQGIDRFNIRARRSLAEDRRRREAREKTEKIFLISILVICFFGVMCFALFLGVILNTLLHSIFSDNSIIFFLALCCYFYFVTPLNNTEPNETLIESD